jgi:hypothetical protein
MKSEVYKEKVNTRDELVTRIMNSAVLIKQECQDDLRRATRTIAKVTVVVSCCGSKQNQPTTFIIQGVSGEIVNILGGGSMNYSE